MACQLQVCAPVDDHGVCIDQQAPGDACARFCNVCSAFYSCFTLMGTCSNMNQPAPLRLETDKEALPNKTVLVPGYSTYHTSTHCQKDDTTAEPRATCFKMLHGCLLKKDFEGQIVKP